VTRTTKVAVAFAGNVTAPVTVFPTTLAVTVPVLATALISVTPPKEEGTRSLKEALVAVLGPAFPTNNVKVVVPPTVNVADPTALLATKSTLGTTPNTAVAVPAFIPTVVETNPGAIVFVKLPPPTLEVTTTEIEQAPPAGITLP
jgi:hypothetical protein